MNGIRGMTFGFLASLAAMLVWAPSVFAQHLDHHQVRVLARHISEKNDQLMDQIDDWVAERPDERSDRGSQLYQDASHFELTLCEFRARLMDHREPWDLRPQVRDMLASWWPLGHRLDRSDFLPDEIKSRGHEIHDALRELARNYRLGFEEIPEGGDHGGHGGGEFDH